MRSGAYQYHEFPLGFVLTEVTQYAAERVLSVVLLWGDRLDEWKDDAVTRLEAFGRAQGCVAIEALARLGLERALGWKRTRVLLRKEISHGR